MFLSLASGALAGAFHVFAGPDHLAVLAPFSVEAGRRAWVVGIRWGVGHAAGLLAVATAAYAVRDLLDLGFMAGASEALIGAVLIAVGCWGLLHRRRPAGPFDETGRDPHIHTTAALLVGTLHGVVGTGSVLAVVPVLAMPSWLQASSYLIGFGVGTIGAMVAFATGLGWAVTARTDGSASPAYDRIFTAASLAALGLGLLWIALPFFGIEIQTHALP